LEAISGISGRHAKKGLPLLDLSSHGTVGGVAPPGKTKQERPIDAVAVRKQISIKGREPQEKQGPGFRRVSVARPLSEVSGIWPTGGRRIIN